MVSLTQALAEVGAEEGKRLLVDVILDEMTDDDAAVLRAALVGPLSAAKIAAAMSAAGYPIGEGAVSKWRRRNAAR